MLSATPISHSSLTATSRYLVATHVLGVSSQTKIGVPGGCPQAKA